MTNKILTVLASFVITVALLILALSTTSEETLRDRSPSSLPDGSGQRPTASSAAQANPALAESQADRRPSSPDLQGIENSIQPSGGRSSDEGQEPEFETILQKMQRLGRPLDGSEYAFVRYKFSPHGMEEILADRGMNPGGIGVDEDVRSRIVSMIKEKRMLVDTLTKERRAIERKIMRDALKRGEFEEGESVNGRRMAPTASSPEESIYAFGADGRAGYFRWKPGISEERDAILAQECMIFSAIEEEIAGVLATLRRSR